MCAKIVILNEERRMRNEELRGCFSAFVRTIAGCLEKNRPGRRKERLTMLLDRRIETGSRSINVFGVPPPEARNHKSSGNGILLTECRNIAVFPDRACCGFRPFRNELLIKSGICPFYRACKRGRNGIFGQKRSVFMRKMTGHFMSDSPSFLVR